MEDTLFIVDTMYLIFRSFYAFGGRQNLTAPDGTPTGAVYGLANSLRSFRHGLKMKYCLCAFESAVTVFRHEISEIYKANRKETDPGLKVQIPIAIEMCQRLGYKTASVDGYEADDVIATVAAQALRQGWKVRIISKDKDLAQLLALEGDIAIIMPSTNFAKNDHYVDANNCKEHYGVPPELIADWLALMGDSSDNIIGVKGIGEKTAAKLLNSCGCLDNLVAQASKAGRFSQAIVDYKEQLAENKRLTTVCMDVPLPWPVESLETFGISQPKAEDVPFFVKLGLNLPKLIS